MEEEKQRLQEEAINLKESLSEALINLEMESAEDITSIATASASLTSNANQVYKRDSLVNILVPRLCTAIFLFLFEFC